MIHDITVEPLDVPLEGHYGVRLRILSTKGKDYRVPVVWTDDDVSGTPDRVSKTIQALFNNAIVTAFDTVEYDETGDMTFRGSK